MPDARESRDAYVSRVEDEGRSQSVCSIHVCVCIYIHISRTSLDWTVLD